MKIGTKSVLFGVHQFILHPLLLAIGWWKAYGFAQVEIGAREVRDWQVDGSGRRWRDTYRVRVSASLLSPRLWLAFFVHDIGYISKPNMDGAEGETHPELGARIMRAVCGEPWGEFCLTHSRYYAKRLGRPVSPLCIADKWVILLEPSWLYLPRARASGELAEFLEVAKKRGAVTMPTDPLTVEERAAFLTGDARVWHRTVKSYMRRWIAEHSGGKADTWTRKRHGSAA